MWIFHNVLKFKIASFTKTSIVLEIYQLTCSGGHQQDSFANSYDNQKYGFAKAKQLNIKIIVG